MKHYRIPLLILAVLCLLFTAAAAEAVNIVAIHASVNGSTQLQAEAGVLLTAQADPGVSRLLVDWRVNGVSQGTAAASLSFTPTGNTVVEAVFDMAATPTPMPVATPVHAANETPAPTIFVINAPAPTPAPREGKAITAVNCSLRMLNRDRTAPQGDAFAELPFGDSSAVSFAVIADVPKGKKIAYWVIDGARYDFNVTVNNILVKDADEAMTFEVVFAGSEASTLSSGTNTTGSECVVTGKYAELIFITDAGKADGGWRTSIDFTNEYTNLASKKKVPGGSVSFRVKEAIPKGRSTLEWKFNNATLRFGGHVASFSVYGLDHSVTYEPQFGQGTYLEGTR